MAELQNSVVGRFPRVWPGLFLALVPFVLILLVPTGPEYKITQRIESFRTDSSGRIVPAEVKDLTPPHPMALYAAAFVATGWVYWLYCIHRMHLTIAKVTAGAYPISASRAVWFHLIPLYNFFWVFRWTSEVAKLVNQAAPGRVAKGAAGTFLCLALVIVYLGLAPPSGVLGHATALGIAIIVGANLSRHLRAAP